MKHIDIIMIALFAVGGFVIGQMFLGPLFVSLVK